MTGENAPKGVIALLIGPNGHVWASAPDFDRSGYGGFSMAQGQELRAKRALAYQYLRAIAHPALAKSISPYGAERIVQDVCRECGYKVVIVAIGYDTEKEPT